MPRSWPNTEPEVLEFDLEPGPVASAPLRKGTRASRQRPLYLIGLVIASVLGLALVPGTKDNSRALVPVETLPEPVATQPIHEGRLEVMVEAPGIVRVLAPPRIELFQSSLVSLPIEVSSWVYRSEGRLNGTPVQSIVAGSNTWTLNAGMLSVESRDRRSPIVTMGAIKGSYDSRSDAVTIAGFLDEPIVIQLNDLQRFRDSADGVWETRVYISSNAVDWSAGDTAFARPIVDILGPIHGGFLLAVRARGNPNRPITFYRTEPIRATNG